MIGVQSATSYELVMGVSLNNMVYVGLLLLQYICRHAGRRYLQTSYMNSGNADSYVYHQERSFVQIPYYIPGIADYAENAPKLGEYS